MEIDLSPIKILDENLCKINYYDYNTDLDNKILYIEFILFNIDIKIFINILLHRILHDVKIYKHLYKNIKLRIII